MADNDNDNEEEDSVRRTLLQAGALSLLTAGALTACGDRPTQLLEADEAQKAHKRKGKSQVLIAKAESYDAVADVLKDAWIKLAPPVRDKSVFLKVNLVDYREGLPVCTNSAVLEAAILQLKSSGARSIKVGDGPALSRDTEEIARLSGISQVCRKHEVEFVDLNIDDLDKIENPLRFTGIDEFLLPRSVTKADMLISMPKLKTHHWALMTCSMKNLFGVVPGRKYGWPKNILHIRGIDKSIIDIVSTIKPSFAIVDAVVAMQGDGPLNGEALNLNLLVLGNDVVAVDTVCGMCMELPVHRIPYLRLAGMCLGNNDLGQIELMGETIESVKMKVKLPPTYEADGSPKDLSKLSKGAETGVT